MNDYFYDQDTVLSWEKVYIRFLVLWCDYLLIGRTKYIVESNS